MHPTTPFGQVLHVEHVCHPTEDWPPFPSTAPPPYPSSDIESNDDDDDDDDDNDSALGEDNRHDESAAAATAVPALKLTINAAHRIQGHHNLVATAPSALADATRFSAILLAAVHQLRAAASHNGGPLAAAAAAAATTTTKRPRSWKVDLTINCGVTVVGDRNVVGHVGLKPKVAAPALGGGGGAAAGALGGGGAAAGAKRGAEECGEGEPAAKRHLATPGGDAAAVAAQLPTPTSPTFPPSG